ncbi:MAG: hypothetical protein P8Y53_20560 [Pseudolabrys sp.]|jgi:hypothetical protein
MAQVYFHYSNTDKVLMNYGAAQVADIMEAREQAALLVGALVATPGPEDWRDWMLHASDDLGEEMFSLPFKVMLGRLH